MPNITYVYLNRKTFNQISFHMLNIIDNWKYWARKESAKYYCAQNIMKFFVIYL